MSQLVLYSNSLSSSSHVTGAHWTLSAVCLLSESPRCVMWLVTDFAFMSVAHYTVFSSHCPVCYLPALLSTAWTWFTQLLLSWPRPSWSSMTRGQACCRLVFACMWMRDLYLPKLLHVHPEAKLEENCTVWSGYCRFDSPCFDDICKCSALIRWRSLFLGTR